MSYSWVRLSAMLTVLLKAIFLFERKQNDTGKKYVWSSVISFWYLSVVEQLYVIVITDKLFLKSTFLAQFWSCLIGFVWVLESFGKLWNWWCHFPGPGKFWKREFFQNGYGKVWIFAWKVHRYPKIDIIQFHIKHHVCYVLSNTEVWELMALVAWRLFYCSDIYIVLYI